MNHGCTTLAVLAGLSLATASFAGPNQGGVVIAHANESVAYTIDHTGGYCGLSELQGCADADVRVDGSEYVVFYAVAAFPETSNPRLAGTTIGIDYDPSEIALVDWGLCGDFELPTSNWPEPGEGVAVTWEVAQTDHATEIYWFAGYSYTGNPSEVWITPHPTRGFEPYFADDAVPANLDVAADTGSLGFNTDGYLPCAPSRSCELALGPAQITAYKPCDGTFPVDLNVAEVEDLGEFSVCFGYADTDQLVFDRRVIDPAFLGSTGRTVTPTATQPCFPFDFPEGMYVGATTSGGPDGPSGSGRLARVYFSIPASASGVASLGLDGWLMEDTSLPQGLIYVTSASGAEVTFSESCYGDYNGDGDVTAFDLAQVVQRWPRCQGDAGYDARYDVDLLEEGNFCASAPDGCVDVVDVQTVAGRWHLGCGSGLAAAGDADAMGDPDAVGGVGAVLEGSALEDAPARGRLHRGAPALRLSPASGLVVGELDDTISVALVIDAASDLGAFEAEISFDPAVLRVSDVDPGTLLGSTGRTAYALAPQVDDEGGTLRFGGCTTGLTAGSSGSGVLARIVFEIVECDVTTDLAIADATITDVTGSVQELGGAAGATVEILCASATAPDPRSAASLSLAIRPNPLSSAAEIAFTVPGGAGPRGARLEVFDAAGRLVRTLLHESLAPGRHALTWDARDDAGRSLPGGAFFCRLRVGPETVEQRIVLSR